MLSSVARTNSAALPVGSTPSNMAEVRSLPLRAMLTAPAPGTQRVAITIRQHVAFCLQTSSKCSIAAPPKGARALCATVQARKPSLKEPAPLLEASKQSLSKKLCPYHSSLTFLQKGASIPWVSASHNLSSCSKSRHPLSC